MTITASMVKDLREKTGAGMMDAKKALEETGGDIEAAVDFLRKKGMAKAEKKSSRTAAEGLIAVQTNGTCGVVVEINAETDFVSRNDTFQGFVKAKTEEILASNAPAESFADPNTDEGAKAKSELTDLIAKIGENMSFRRAAKLEVEDGVVCGYVHGAVADGLGKIGVLVALQSAGDKDKLEALGKQLAMHVAAAFPKYLDRDEVDASEIEREKAILIDQAKASGKPDNVIEKMVEGRISKFYGEICLIEQIFIMDNETKISALLENAAKDVGAPIVLAGFARYQLGEGIEKEQEDFAAEVSKVANG